MRALTITTLTLAVATMSVSCSSLDKQLDQKLNQAPVVRNRSDLNSEATNYIEKVKGLTPDQRSKLLELRDVVRTKTTQAQNDSLKLRSLLVKEVLSGAYNPDEVELIKDRLKKLEDKRLTDLFNTVDQANRIIGRASLENKGLMYFELYDVPLHDGNL